MIAAISSGRLAAYLAVFVIRRHEGLPVTSEQISAATGINATQVRRDLSGFGRNGKRGVGYNCDRMIQKIRGELDGAGVVIQGGAAIIAGHAAATEATTTTDPPEAWTRDEAATALETMILSQANGLRMMDTLIDRASEPS